MGLDLEWEYGSEPLREGEHRPERTIRRTRTLSAECARFASCIGPNRPDAHTISSLLKTFGVENRHELVIERMRRPDRGNGVAQR